MHKCTISRPRKQMHLPRGLTQLLKAGRSEMLTIIITNQPSKLWQSPASQWKSKRTHLYLLGASTSSTTVTRSGRWKAQYQIKLHLILQNKKKSFLKNSFKIDIWFHFSISQHLQIHPHCQLSLLKFPPICRFICIRHRSHFSIHYQHKM